MTDTTTEIRIEARPYKPSWIDRFNTWVEKLPVRAWIFYVVFGIVLILVQMLFLWLDRGLQAEGLLPVIIFNGLATPFSLALIRFLDNLAVTALNSMRPVLDTTGSEFGQYDYRLSNMPSPLPLVTGLTLVVFLILSERLWLVPIRFAALEQLPIFAVVFHVLDKITAFLFGVLIYHTIRQLRLVNAINSKHIRVNLFNLMPLQAFSKLTASTAVGLVVGVYGWILINPELMRHPVTFGFIVMFTILAVLVFVWPLYGVHRLLEVAKERALHEIDLRFEAAFSKFNIGFRDDDYSVIERLNGTIVSLEIQHRRVMAIPTWPWRPETARIALTAIALPLVLAILRFLVEQTFDW